VLVPLALPDGLWARPLTPRDAATVTALVAAQELADVGGIGIEEADLVADWQHPGYDVTACSVGVFDGDRLVAYAELGGERAEAAVHPDHRGRGLGTALATWLQELARRHGRTTLRLAMPEGSPGWASGWTGRSGRCASPPGPRCRAAPCPRGTPCARRPRTSTPSAGR